MKKLQLMKISGKKHRLPRKFKKQLKKSFIGILLVNGNSRDSIGKLLMKLYSDTGSLILVDWFQDENPSEDEKYKWNISNK